MGQVEDGGELAEKVVLIPAADQREQSFASRSLCALGFNEYSVVR